MLKNLKRANFVDSLSVARRVAANWEINHPNYSVNFTNYSDLAQHAVTLKDACYENSLHSTKKSENTAALKDINRQIRIAIKMLRLHIKMHYTGENIEDIYRSYGMETPGEVLVKAKEREKTTTEDGKVVDNRPRKKKSYAAPTDNDTLIRLTSLIVAKLNEDSNPLKTTSFGYEHWLRLQAEHQLVWENSDNMRSRKSSLSRQANELRTKTTAVLMRLKKQIRVDFEAYDTNKVLREFGFLEESQ